MTSAFSLSIIMIGNEGQEKMYIMDYMELANELIDVQGLLLQVPAEQKLSKMAMGSLFVLNYLAFNEGCVHPKDLSEKMAVSSARIARLLNYLEEKKMVRRYADPQDNRQVIVVLTETGRNEIHRIRAEVLPSLADMLEKIGPEDAEAFIRIQKKIWSSYQSDKEKVYNVKRP